MGECLLAARVSLLSVEGWASRSLNRLGFSGGGLWVLLSVVEERPLFSGVACSITSLGLSIWSIGVVTGGEGSASGALTAVDLDAGIGIGAWEAVDWVDGNGNDFFWSSTGSAKEALLLFPGRNELLVRLRSDTEELLGEVEMSVVGEAVEVDRRKAGLRRDLRSVIAPLPNHIAETNVIGFGGGFPTGGDLRESIFPAIQMP